jgi:hypothetical protein
MGRQSRKIAAKKKPRPGISRERLAVMIRLMEMMIKEKKDNDR